VDHETESVKIRVRVTPKTRIGVDLASGESKSAVALLNPGYDELKEKYDALVIAHDKLLKEYTFVEERMVRHDRAVAEAAMEVDISPEDAADLAAAKEVLSKSQFVPLTGIDPGPEGEPELADGPANCDNDCDKCKSNACKPDEVDETTIE